MWDVSCCLGRYLLAFDCQKVAKEQEETNRHPQGQGRVVENAVQNKMNNAKATPDDNDADYRIHIEVRMCSDAHPFVDGLLGCTECGSLILSHVDEEFKRQLSGIKKPYRASLGLPFLQQAR